MAIINLKNTSPSNIPMKPYILNFFLLFVLFNSCYICRTSPERDLIDEIIYLIPDKNKKKPKSTLYFDNTQYVTKQIQYYLKKYTELPKDMSELSDVRIFLEVNISKSGEIEEYSIVTTTHPSLNEKVLNAMKALKSVYLIGNKYEGSAKIYVLVKRE